MSIKLHLGCGSVYKPGWINIDLDSPKADVLQDLTSPLPYEDDSVELIYSEHFIEHITRAQARDFLKECRRVLSDSGTLRLSTPDLAFLVKCYKKKNIAEWGNLWGPDSPCNLMNEGMRSWGHQYLYDQRELTRALREAGFSAPRRMRWGASNEKALKGLETRPFHRDLIMEVGKTARPLSLAQKWLPW